MVEQLHRGARDPDRQRVLTEVVAMLVRVTGEDDEWAARITDSTRLEDDLRLESVEVAALGDLVRERFGEHVDLTGLYADLDIDQVIALTVGDVAAYVAGVATIANVNEGR